VENDLANAHAQYAFYLYDHLRADLALEQIQEARKLIGDFAELHFVLGRIAEQDNHYSDAIWEYEETIRLDQKHTRAKESLVRLKTMHPSLFEPVITKPPVIIPPRPPKPVIPTQKPVVPIPEPVEIPPEKPHKQPGDMYAAIDFFAEKNNFNPDFIETIIKIESGYNPEAVSEADCRGLMQLGRGAWSDCTKRLGLNWDFDKDAFDPVKNIQIGCEYLRWMRDDYFPEYQKELSGIPMELQLIQGYHSGPWRTVVYEGKVPGPRMARYRELYVMYRSMGQ
jgi:tetratricopeptide (TPR) repeat protein